MTRQSTRNAPAVEIGGRLWAPVLVLPALALIVGFFLYPFGVIVFHAFTEWDGIAPARFNGLDNFRLLWEDTQLRVSLRNGFLFAAVVPLQVAVSLVVAALVYQQTPRCGGFSARCSSCRCACRRS